MLPLSASSFGPGVGITGSSASSAAPGYSVDGSLSCRLRPEDPIFLSQLAAAEVSAFSDRIATSFSQVVAAYSTMLSDPLARFAKHTTELRVRSRPSRIVNPISAIRHCLRAKDRDSVSAKDHDSSHRRREGGNKTTHRSKET